MKIVRFVTEGGKICLGSFDPARPGEARIIAGDLFGDLEQTDQTSRIGRLLSPVDPPNILAVGLNYGHHAEETNIRRPEMPVIFIKANSSVIGPEEMILLPHVGPDQVDYEAELAVIIGRKAKNISREEALEYVLGYTCANDVSARDWQIEKQKKQWSRGKSFDTFCPLGPCLVTRDEIPDPNRLAGKLRFIGSLMLQISVKNLTDFIRFFLVAVNHSDALADQFLPVPAEDHLDGVIGEIDSPLVQPHDGLRNRVENRRFQRLQLLQAPSGFLAFGDVHGIAQNGPPPLESDGHGGFHDPLDPSVFRDNPKFIGGKALPFQHHDRIFGGSSPVFRQDERRGAHLQKLFFGIARVIQKVGIDELKLSVLHDVAADLRAVRQNLVQVFFRRDVQLGVLLGRQPLLQGRDQIDQLFFCFFLQIHSFARFGLNWRHLNTIEGKNKYFSKKGESGK